MIVVDTNVISELAKPNRAAAVNRWAEESARAELVTTTITIAELRYGIARLPQGRRRSDLEASNELLLARLRTVLPFDFDAAVHAGDIRAVQRATGRSVGVADVQIAGICRSRGATLATRNIRDFEGLGLDLVDPWEPT